VLLTAAVVGLVLTASACGGGKKPAETTNGSSATVEWASGVCSAFTEWKTALHNLTLHVGISGAPLRQAGRQAQNATEKLAQSLENLGAPGTNGGEQAKQSLAALESSLSQSISTIESAMPRHPSAAEAATALTTVRRELTLMAQDLTKAVYQVKNADPSGELGRAFHQASSCAPYV